MQTARRLTLAKESLRPLGDSSLARAQGGIILLTSIVFSCATADCSPTQDSTGSFSCGKIGSCCDEEV